jgi:hypothetical protein
MASRNNNSSLFLNTPKHIYGMRNFILLTLLLVLCAGKLCGQFALSAVHYRPTGEFGFVMKPLTTVELTFMSRFSDEPDERFRFGMSLMYLRMKPRLNSFPIWAYGSDDRGAFIYPGEQSFSRYNITFLSGGADFAVIHKERFNWFIGADLMIGGASIDYQSTVVGWKDESYSGGGLLIGFRVRIGVEYQITDHISLFSRVNRHFFLITDPATLGNANDYGVGIRYALD